jgi:indolepyruvate ferredoxin oxidoreductase
MPDLDGNYSIVVAGIGGTGVVTIAALLGMAAHLEGKGVSVFDMTGLSQKNGAVYSHLWLLDDPTASAPAKVGLAEADLILGCDLVAAAGADAMHSVKRGETRAVLNSALVPTASFQENRDLNIDGRMLELSISAKVGDSRVHVVDASKLALKLLGNTIGTNIFLIGFALQKNCIPLTIEAIERAIELNGVAVDFNLRALKLGRLAAVDIEKVESLLPATARNDVAQVKTVDEVVAHRTAALIDYQDEAYAARYTRVVATARRAENALGIDSEKFTVAVASSAYKVMAYKDEYAVARMFADGEFEKSLAATFEGDYELHFHLAPPLLSRRDPATGEARKSEYGPWVFRAFKMLAKLKGLRGTAWDVFGYTTERKNERALRDAYLADIERLTGSLTLDTLPTAVEIAEIPEQIRGYGHVKQKAMAKAKVLRKQLFSDLTRSREMERAA